jgi:hypothetical protein
MPRHSHGLCPPRPYRNHPGHGVSDGADTGISKLLCKSGRPLRLRVRYGIRRPDGRSVSASQPATEPRDALLEALRRFDFDTVMFPPNCVLWTIPEYRHAAEALLTDCGRRDVGVQVIKSVAKYPWGDRPKIRNTWYAPFADQRLADQAVRFAPARPVTTLCSAGDKDILPPMLAATERAAAALEPAAALLASAGRYHTPFVGRWPDT